MNSAAALGIGTDRWHLRTEERLMIAVKLTAELSLADPAAPMPISLVRMGKTYLAVCGLNRRIAGELRRLDQFARKFQVAMIFPSVEHSRATRDSLLRWYEECSRVLLAGKGFARTGPLQRQFGRLTAQTELLMDQAYWFDALSRPEEIKARFEAALVDLAKGDIVPISAIRRI